VRCWRQRPERDRGGPATLRGGYRRCWRLGRRVRCAVLCEVTAERSVIGRSPVVAAMCRVFESAPRHVDHRAVRSGRASGRPLRREAQGFEIGTRRWCPPLPSAMNTRRSAIRRSLRRSPITSQRRRPPSTIAATIARSRWLRRALVSASTSDGARILGRVRVPRTSGTPCPGRCRSPRVGRPRGTGLVATSPRACRNAYRPETLEADAAASASTLPPAHHRPAGRSARQSHDRSVERS
jgi:hypothetical protein